MTTTTTNERAVRLRQARERMGVTRAELAEMAGCSLTSLANIEQGAVPRRSDVLERAERALLSIKSEAAPAGGSAKASGKGARRDGS